MVNLSKLIMQSKHTTDAQKLAAMKADGQWYGKDVDAALALHKTGFGTQKIITQSTVRAPFTADYEIQAGVHSGYKNRKTGQREFWLRIFDEKDTLIKEYVRPHPSLLKVKTRLERNWMVVVKPAHRKNRIRLIGA